MAAASSATSSIVSGSMTPSLSVGGGSSSSPCAACKFLRRKCQPDCVFAPYFPPDNPQKFIHVHRVFGASNVTKLLNELHPYQREDAVNSLAYEADMRLRDPVYGCVGVISLLQHQLRQLQIEISCAKSELSKYQSAFGSPTTFASSTNNLININTTPSPVAGNNHMGQFFPVANSREQQQQMTMMMRNNYDIDLPVRSAVNVAYDAGLVSAAAMNASAASVGQFMKPSTAGGDERQGIGPS